MSLQSLSGKNRKICTRGKSDRRIKIMCIYDKIKSSGCIQCEKAQANLMLSKSTVRQRPHGIALKLSVGATVYCFTSPYLPTHICFIILSVDILYAAKAVASLRAPQ